MGGLLFAGSAKRAARLLASNKSLSRGDFRLLRKEGTRLAGKCILLECRVTSRPTRLGITISKKYGKAHVRNRFKRIVRAGFRDILPLFPTNLDLNVLPRYSFATATSIDIARELKTLLHEVQHQSTTSYSHN